MGGGAVALHIGVLLVLALPNWQRTSSYLFMEGALLDAFRRTLMTPGSVRGVGKWVSGRVRCWDLMPLWGKSAWAVGSLGEVSLSWPHSMAQGQAVSFVGSHLLATFGSPTLAMHSAGSGAAFWMVRRRGSETSSP